MEGEVSKEEQIITCPKCGLQDPTHKLAIRQGYVNGVWVTDIGWRCLRCGHEWGFELL